MTDEITLTYSDEWAAIRIDRAHRLNALDRAAISAFAEAVESLHRDPRPRVVIESVGDRAFVAGGDLKDFSALASRTGATAMSRAMSDALSQLEQLPSLVIAAVRGHAFGGGVELILACDLVIAVPSTKLGLTQARFALLPGWGGATRLAERVGRRRAFSLLASGAVLGASDALRLGIVDELSDDPEGAARRHRLPTSSCQHLRSLRAALSPAAWRHGQLEGEREPFVDSWMTDEHMARVDAFLERSSE